MKFTEKIASYIYFIACNQKVSQQAKIKNECVAYRKYNQISERGMFSHFGHAEHDQRYQIADRAAYNPKKRDF